jgi:hypothetical protein
MPAALPAVHPPLTAAPGGRYKGGVSPLYAELHCHSYYSFLDGTSA